jgi:hypothetical protein
MPGLGRSQAGSFIVLMAPLQSLIVCLCVCWCVLAAVRLSPQSGAGRVRGGGQSNTPESLGNAEPMLPGDSGGSIEGLWGVGFSVALTHAWMALQGSGGRVTGEGLVPSTECIHVGTRLQSSPCKCRRAFMEGWAGQGLPLSHHLGVWYVL